MRPCVGFICLGRQGCFWGLMGLCNSRNVTCISPIRWPASQDTTYQPETRSPHRPVSDAEPQICCNCERLLLRPHVRRHDHRIPCSVLYPNQRDPMSYCTCVDINLQQAAVRRILVWSRCRQEGPSRATQIYQAPRWPPNVVRNSVESSF
jgi:hypothetical protein